MEPELKNDKSCNLPGFISHFSEMTGELWLLRSYWCEDRAMATHSRRFVLPGSNPDSNAVCLNDALLHVACSGVITHLGRWWASVHLEPSEFRSWWLQLGTSASCIVDGAVQTSPVTCLVACDLEHSFVCNLVLAVTETPSILLKRQIYANLKLTNQDDNETMISSYHHIWLQYCTLRTIQPIYYHIHLDLGPSQGSVLVMSLLPFWNVPSLWRQSFRPQRSSRHLRLFLVSEPWLRKKLHVWWVWWKVILCSPYSSPRGRDRQTLEFILYIKI